MGEVVQKRPSVRIFCKVWCAGDGVCPQNLGNRDFI